MIARELMSGVDAAWLHMDRPENTADVVALMTFRERLGLDEVRRLLADRIASHPRFRQRIVPDGVLALAAWDEDPAFDLARHVVERTVPARGQRALDRLAGEVATEKLDPSHPLWRAYLVTGHGAGSALVMKLHHCIADGFALVGLLLSMADEVQIAEPGAPQRPTPACRDLRLRESPAVALWHALADRTRAADLAARAVAFARSLAGMTVLPPAPRTALSRPLSGLRRTAWSRAMALPEIKITARRLGATVNDVLVTALAGALRGHLRDAGEPVDALELRALVPVNLREQPPSALHGEMGNRFGLVFLDLPIRAEGVLTRLEAVRARMAELKRTPDAVVTYAVLSALGHLPPPLEYLVTEFFSRKAALVLTNVPGPRAPLHLGGHEIRRISFCVPHPAALGLGVSILSYAGEVRIGARADVAVMRDPGDLVRRIPAELEALSRIAVA
jgi:diacylglycerol O-acyltransferase